jgi:choline-sulfatase
MKRIALLMLVCVSAFPLIWAQSTPNLLLITIDTLRADFLGCYGNRTVSTPNLDNLAKGSLFFRNAISAAPLTLPSHTSLMTGMYPYHHGVHDNAGVVNPSELTLAEILRKNGYNTYAFIGGFPLDHRFGLNQGFQLYDDAFPRVKNRSLDFRSERSADAVANSVMRASIQEPFFVWIHFYDPHAPYLHGGYAGEIAYVDHVLAKLAQRFQNDHTFQALAGDHGESLGEHGELTHRIFLYDATIRVPFWIKGPGVPSKIIEKQARLIDFLPTILSFMNIDPPGHIDGKILPQNAGAAAYVESRFPQLQLGWSPLVGIRTDQWKYIQAPHPELYFLASDPGEKKNLAAERKDILHQFQAQMPSTGTAPGDHPQISPEMAEQLASLGYVGGKSAGETGVDPKEKIRIWNQIEKAVDLEESQPDEAVALLEKLRKEDPQNPMLLTLLAQKYSDLQKPAESKQILSEILRRDPENWLALYQIANVCLKTNEPGEAKKWAKMLLQTGQNRIGGLQILARADIALKNFDEAASDLTQLLQLDRDDVEAKLDLGNLYLQYGKLEQGKIQFDEILRKDPASLQAWNGLATYSFMKEDLAAAEVSLRKALSLDSSDAQTRMNLALVFATQGKKQEAIRLYREVAASKTIPEDWKTQAAARLKELQP